MKFRVETEQIGADLSKVVDRVVKQYENFPNAFQKDGIQNAWDVRLDRKEGNEWKIKIYTYEEGELTHLVIEDFGTYGMNKERWEAFLSLWKPKKEYLDAGGQGQGKFVLMRASIDHILIVESISDETSYQCRFLQNDQKSEENQRYSIKDFISGIKPLNHKGTKIWIYNVEKDFLKIIRSKEFSESIIESWWQLLGKRFSAKIYLFDKEINLLELPSPTQEIILLENKQLENFGRIKRLILIFYKNPIPEIFRGIRIQRANMMIIKIPFEVYEKEYQGCFSGYIEFDKDLEKNLKDIEKTDHGGFLFESPWKEIKSIVKDEAEKFVNRIIPKKEKRKRPEFKMVL